MTKALLKVLAISAGTLAALTSIALMAGQDEEPTIKGTTRSYSNVPYITVEGETLELCNKELENSRTLIVRKGISVTLEKRPCEALVFPGPTGSETMSYTGTLYFMSR